MKNVIKYMKGYRLVFGLAILSIVAATVMQLATPILIQYTIDSIIGTEPAGDLQFLMDRFGRNIMSIVGLVLGIALIRAVFLFLKGYFSSYAAENIAQNLRDKLYKQIQYMSYEYHTKRETGDLIQRCTSDVETIRRFLGVQIVDLGRILLMVTLSVIIMVRMSPKLTVYAVLMIPVLFAFSFIFFTKVQKNFKKADEAEAQMTTVIQENLSGVRVVRAFGREKYEIDKFETVNHGYKEKVYKLIEILAGFWSSSDFLTLVQSGIVLVVGARMVITGEITIGILVAFITYESMLLWPVKQLGRLLSEFGKTTVSINRIEEILSEPIEQVMPYETRPEIKGEIIFEHVNFSYPDGKQVLKDINFKIEPGETLGILGSTGSGKSTLVHLLQRLYEYEGTIKIDGQELKTIEKQWTRQKIGLVLQEPYLYAKTVKQNIGILRNDFEEAEIYEAAKTASIHDNILTFRDGYETVIGEKGVSLSGGQKQRVAISRTIIDSDKRILVFDDSLSAVDTETDMKIRKALKKRSKDVTTLIISHRISTLAEADTIIVLDQGRIIQKGSHEALLEEEGLYKRIWDLQKMVV
ncbi:ABC transporter ATP-binding protein [Fusibacter tunisiensis]|uniref:ATP-binding cassette subfamily B protein n=1 Tax=Fusibacter tunisiensis TaxID=1008308 RepID=A0ABS2MQM2_9FIRM|nr:ABC transporter ATP-binding protein [Fusibacter tunisiensis]MBM7561632.1 ATP-binding cassette subfamily B protein [Fusibacter tunisiensis]